MEKFRKKLWLSSPTTHNDGLKYVEDAYEKNWISTLGENIDAIEQTVSEKIGCANAVALSCGTAALHLAVKVAGVKPGDTVFCTDMTFAASVNPIIYEGGIPVFIGTEYETWNMDPVALEKAFELYPKTKVVIVTNLYGTPARFDEICAVAEKYGAVIIEDAAESLGAKYKGRQTGTFGKYNVISFNGNKIITGSTGGMLLTNEASASKLVRKWSTQSREVAPWYQHEEVGYNYRMSNIIAGMVRGQLPYLEEHIERKKAIYNRYRDGLKSLPITMNPYIEGDMEPNFWLSCILIDKAAMSKQIRYDNSAEYVNEKGKSCPTQIHETLAAYNAEGRPIWKPMHLQPIYKKYPFVTRQGASASADDDKDLIRNDIGADIFERGLCLPSDIKMTEQDQDNVIEIIKSCFA